MNATNPSVSHNDAKQRFVISVDDREVGYTAYDRLGADVLDFNHTVVDQAYRGRNLSTPLIKEALDWARGEGARVVASCSAVQHFIDKHPDYSDLVAR